MEKDLTHGNTLKLIISFCIPLIGGAIFQQLYNVVDTMIVGRFVGVDALAAVGSTGSLNFLIIGFVLGLAAGFGIPIAQAFGAREEKRMLQTIMNAFYLCIFFSIVLTVLTHFTTETLLQWMQTPANIFKQSYDYISIIFYGAHLSSATNGRINFILRWADLRRYHLVLLFYEFRLPLLLAWHHSNRRLLKYLL